MKKTSKMLIAGIGGQGVVYLTNLVTESALAAGIPVASSEVHGLSQRRGSVVAGITFGEGTYGYVEEAGAEFLIGLEPLEAVRCVSLLNAESKVIVDNNPIYPHSVTVGKTTYPDIDSFIDFLKANIKQTVFNQDFDNRLNPILRNTYILGRATQLEGFPIPSDVIEQVIGKTAKAKYKDDSVGAFRLGMNKEIN
ncbi:MAG: 2-oxoacid:acceptor oxidoreductase family protein [Calditrichaeota bacterium]|nr:2-oxoacid:acceptor oxidoreductase family protein [Calditrichota bacterium]